VRVSFVDLAIVGAGPCGLAAAVAATRAGLSVVLFDRGPIVAGIASYPTYMTFFSTAERLSIGGVPFVVADEKPTRRDALAYYRAVASHYNLPVRQYETVEQVAAIEPDHDAVRPARYQLTSRTRGGARTGHARPRDLCGHRVLRAPQPAGRARRRPAARAARLHRRALRLARAGGGGGGGNSAVDAALELLRSDARVHLVHMADDLDRGVKPWVRPVIANRIHDESIIAHFGSRVTRIEPESVTIEGPEGEQQIAATQVYLLTGYLPETGLLAELGVPIDEVTGIPTHDPATMATPLPGVYLAGVIASGFDANKIFIENGRDHGDLIVAHLLAAAAR
jgi:thioredoxin reductase (NADPH)